MSTRRQSCAFHGQLMRLNTFFNTAENFVIQSIINYLGEFFLTSYIRCKVSSPSTLDGLLLIINLYLVRYYRFEEF